MSSLLYKHTCCMAVHVPVLSDIWHVVIPLWHTAVPWLQDAVMRQGIAQVHPGLCQLSPGHQGGRGHRPLLRHHTLNKRPSSSFLPPRPCSYLFPLCPLPRRKEASRIYFQSSILSLIPHCPAAVPGHFLWLGARQTVFSSTNRHPSASWASLGCYSVIRAISPVPDTSELHLG